MKLKGLLGWLKDRSLRRPWAIPITGSLVYFALAVAALIGGDKGSAGVFALYGFYLIALGVAIQLAMLIRKGTYRERLHPYSLYLTVVRAASKFATLVGERPDRAEAHLRENPGSLFIVGFMVLLVAAAAALISGLSSLANEIAIYSFYALMIGVGIQLVQLIRKGPEEAELAVKEPKPEQDDK